MYIFGVRALRLKENWVCWLVTSALLAGVMYLSLFVCLSAR